MPGVGVPAGVNGMGRTTGIGPVAAAAAGPLGGRAATGAAATGFAATGFAATGFAATGLADLGVPVSLAFGVLATAAVMLLCTSGLRDTVLAENGVRAGWFVRRFEELEEWRLTGDHLRWRLFGEWQACEVPPDQRADLRAKLEQSHPELERTSS